ncbi:MAG: hypothetical protein U1F98_15640 [Verrucomicrobiota bacterium]
MKPQSVFRFGGARRNGWFALLLLAVSGCFTEQRVVWSPDGRRAAVLTQEGLRLCDGDGRLSPLLLAKPVSVAAWFGDSRQLLLATAEPCTNWAGISRALEPGKITALREYAVALRARFGSEKPAAVLAGERDKSRLKAALLFLRDSDAAGAAIVAGLPASDATTNLEVTVGTVMLAEAGTNDLALGPTLATELGFIADLRLSPDDRWLAYTVSASDEAACLMVATARGGRPARPLSDYASLYPDWSADGRSVLFIALVNTNTPNDDVLSLATLTRQQVVDEAGALNPGGRGEELVGLVFNENARVRSLRDGRILFASEEWRLPATTKEMPQRQQLFSFDPAKQSTLTAVVPVGARENLPAGLGYFEVSPDQKRVVFAGGKGEIAVLTLASGEVEQVQGETGRDLKSLPSWRFPRELCYVSSSAAATNAATGQSEVVLRENGKMRVLSAGWPAAARAGWLE